MSRHKLACKLRRQSLPKAVRLVHRLEKRKLARFHGSLVHDRSYTSQKVGHFVFTVRASNQVCRFEKLHLGVNQTGIHVIRIAPTVTHPDMICFVKGADCVFEATNLRNASLLDVKLLDEFVHGTQNLSMSKFCVAI